MYCKKRQILSATLCVPMTHRTMRVCWYWRRRDQQTFAIYCKSYNAENKRSVQAKEATARVHFASCNVSLFVQFKTFWLLQFHHCNGLKRIQALWLVRFGVRHNFLHTFPETLVYVISRESKPEIVYMSVLHFDSICVCTVVVCEQNTESNSEDHEQTV